MLWSSGRLLDAARLACGTASSSVVFFDIPLTKALMVAVELLIMTTFELGGQDFVVYSRAIFAAFASRTLIWRDL